MSHLHNILGSELSEVLQKECHTLAQKAVENEEPSPFLTKEKKALQLEK